MEQKTRLHIGGMTCVNCQHRIQKALKSTEGVHTTEVSYADGTADVAYDPQRITLAQIISVRWEIVAPEGSINGCNNRILIQPLGIEYSFHRGQNIIEFTPDTPGTIPYSCWMGMIHGNIFVTDKTPS